MFLKYILRTIATYETTIIYELDLKDFAQVPRIYTRMKVNVRCACRPDIEKMVRENKKYGRKILRRLEDDNLCFVAEDEHGKVIGYCWIAFDKMYISEIDRSMKLGFDEAMIYDAFVFQEYRGKKVFEKMLRTICGYLMRKGFLRTYTGALSTNIPSRRGIERMGFKERGAVTLFKLFGLKRYSEQLRTSEQILWSANQIKTN